MQNSNFDILKISNFAPGWQEEWGRLCEVLVCGQEGATSLDGPLVWICRRIAGNSTIKQEPEDLVSELLLLYTSKVENRTLFKSFDFERDCVAYLCSFRYIQKCFRQMKCMQNTLCLLSKHREDDSLMPSHGDSTKSGELDELKELEDKRRFLPLKKLEKKQKKLDRTFHELRKKMQTLILPPTSPSQQRYAALQLYLKVSRKDSAMSQLLVDLCTQVLKAHDFESLSESDGVIRRNHVTARGRHRLKIKELRQNLMGTEFRKSETRERAYKVLQSTIKEQYFYPLATGEVMKILNVSQENANQLFYRYKIQKSQPVGNGEAEYVEKISYLDKILEPFANIYQKIEEMKEGGNLDD